MTGLDLIKQYEGLRLEAYLCPAGVPTIGYGHTKGVKIGQKITEDQADKLLADDFLEAESEAAKLITVPLTVNQLDALASFVFNLGASKLLGSTLRRKLNTGDYKGAAEEFDKWVFAGGKKLNGLIARRAAESKLFLMCIKNPQSFRNGGFILSITF